MSRISTGLDTPNRTRIASLVLLACLGVSAAQATGSLYLARNFPEHFVQGSQQTTFLPDGTIFKYSACQAAVYGGSCAHDLSAGNFAEVSLWNPATLQWDTESVGDYMSYCTSTLTHDGRIVMVGGFREFDHSSTATTGMYDSRTQTYRSGPTLGEPRHLHTATELSDGSVLVAGGETAPYQTTAGVELITTGGWRKTLRPMLQDRARHTATRLPSGNILIVGGSRYIPRVQHPNDYNRDTRYPEFAVLDTVELYDVAENRWSAMPPLPAPRMLHTTTVLPDGRVMIIGGLGGAGQNKLSVGTSVLLLDPTTGHWSAAHDLPRAHHSHMATLLPSGDVLVSGGWDERMEPIKDLMLWDHRTGEWSNAGRTHDAVGLTDHSTALLPNGNVLLIPGFSERMAVWSPLPTQDPSGNWVSPREAPTITRLTDGRFLVAGGGGGFQYNPMFYAHIYDPATRRWSDTAEMHYPREHHQATRLADGRVLVFGGRTAPSLGSSYGDQQGIPAEIWDPRTAQWQLFPTLATKELGDCTTEPEPDCMYGRRTEVRSLADGRVLFGAETTTDASAPKEFAYITWVPGDLPPTNAERVKSLHSGGRLSWLDNGNLLHVGGHDSSGQPSTELDILDLDSKAWRPAGTLLHPPADPVILDLGDRRLLIFDRSSDELVATGDLWDEASGSTQAITLPSGIRVIDARTNAEDAARSQNEFPRRTPIGAWRAIGLSSGKILLITAGRSYLSEPPYEHWETIPNDGKARAVHSYIEPLPNGNVLVFTGAPLDPSGICDSCFDVSYHGQYQLSEFDSVQNQWQSIFTFDKQEQTAREGAVPGAWPTNFLDSGGPFHFIVAAHPNIELKVRMSYRHELFLAMCLLLCPIVALIYWKRRRAALTIPAVAN